jgi:DNA polymerase sigma
MDLEPNLRKLVFVLRYWIKQKNLYSKSRFNSYTIIWLVIFYMQTKKIGNLPTVEKLSKISSKKLFEL